MFVALDIVEYEHYLVGCGQLFDCAFQVEAIAINPVSDEPELPIFVLRIPMNPQSSPLPGTMVL